MSQFYDQASLVMVPSGYKAGKVYSQKPLSTDGELTFTRNSNATRVNADGLVEKVRENVNLYSQEFDNAQWTKFSTTVTANNAAAPDGTQTADLIDTGTTTGTHYIEKNRSTGAVGVSLSIYAKYVNAQYLLLGVYDTAYRVAAFDIQNGTIGNYAGTIVPKIENVGGGWYRCSIAYAGNTPMAVTLMPGGKVFLISASDACRRSVI